MIVVTDRASSGHVSETKREARRKRRAESIGLGIYDGNILFVVTKYAI